MILGPGRWKPPTSCMSRRRWNEGTQFNLSLGHAEILLLSSISPGL
ncbi:hypothetical protein [Acinetobacter schindleri]